MAQLKLKQLDSVLTGSLVVSGSHTITGSLYVSASIFGDSLVLGEEAYSLGANYVGLKTTFQTGSNDYMIISGKSDGSTYISAKDNSSVEIRGGGNRSGNAIIIPDDTYIKLGGSATTLLRPESDNSTDLGSAAVRYKDIHLAGDFSGSATSTGLFGNLRVQSSILTINNGSVSGSATSTGSFGVIRVGGILYGPVDDHFDIKSDKDVRVYLDKDADGSFHKFQIFDGTGNVRFAVAEDGKAAIGEAVTSNHIDGLSVAGGISGSGNITGSDIYSAGAFYGDGSNLTGINVGSSGIFVATGSSYNTTNNLEISGSLLISGSTLTVRTGTDSGAITASTAIFTNNITNGYPTSNAWQESLEGSYFNNFDNTTHVSEILRFMAGIISHSIDTSSPTANTKTFGSVDTNETNLSGTDTIYGYLPQSYTSLSNATLNYLVLKDWTGVGEKIFDSIDVYHDNGPTYYIDFDSNSAGSTSVRSSADTELFGLGGLTSGAETEFKVRVHATQSFSDTGSVAAPDESSNTFTTQSYIDYSATSFGTTNGLELAKIASANPAVIPAAYQDGKFENVGGTAMSGSLSRKYGASATDFTSVSASGWYRFHGLVVGIATGSGNYQEVNGTTKNNFWAPKDTIDTAIGTNTLADVGTTTKHLTCVSRSLSGVPYVTGSTYEVSTKITGLFNPMYKDTSTLVDMAGGSVGFGSVSVTNDSVSTAGGTIQTANAVYDSGGSSARSTGTVPYYNDIVLITGSVDWDAGNDDGINQTGTGDSSFTVATKARNRNGSQTTLDTQTIKYHLAGNFGQPVASGSLGIYGREQGYDGGTLQGTTELFTGEDFRIQLADNVQAFNGTAWVTTYALGQLGNYDLQVKPGFLVDPGGDYRYWFPEDYGSGTYKYYIRRFQTDGSTYSSMTVNLNNNTLIAWNATTNGVSCALLFESSGNGSGNNASLGTARIYDPVKTTSNLIEADISADNFKNPFSTAISLYGNSGGSIASGTYTVPIRNADGMYLDSNDNELYVIVRYKGDPTPIDDITLTFS